MHAIVRMLTSACGILLFCSGSNDTACSDEHSNITQLGGALLSVSKFASLLKLCLTVHFLYFLGSLLPAYVDVGGWWCQANGAVHESHARCDAKKGYLVQNSSC